MTLFLPFGPDDFRCHCRSKFLGVSSESQRLSVNCGRLISHRRAHVLTCIDSARGNEGYWRAPFYAALGALWLRLLFDAMDAVLEPGHRDYLSATALLLF